MRRPRRGRSPRPWRRPPRRAPIFPRGPRPGSPAKLSAGRPRPADRANSSRRDRAASTSPPRTITPKNITLSHAVALQHLAHGVDQLLLRHRELRRPALAPFLVRGDRRGGLGAFDEILDLHLAPVLLLGSLDDDAGRGALVGIFELRSHLAGAEIELGADAGGAQRVDHALVVGDALLV